MENIKRRVLNYRSLALLLFLLSFVLRVRNLAMRSLWFDESMEYWVALSPLSQLLPNVRQALQDPPLYSLLLHLWLVVGHHEFSIRFLSLILSLLGILGVMVFARLAFGRKVSLVVGLLAAVSAPDIRFAQEAGQYALMVCLLSWNLIFLFLFTKRQMWKWGILWGITSVLGAYSYYGTTITIAVTMLVSLLHSLSRRQWRVLRRWGLIGVCCLLLLLPLIVDWLPEQFFRGPTAKAFQLPFGSFGEEVQRFLDRMDRLLMFQAMGYGFNQWPWPNIPSWSVGVAMVALLLIGIVTHGPRLPFLWFGVTLLVYYGIGRAGMFPFGTRYSLILSPLLWTCMAAGAVGEDWLRSLWRAFPLVVVVVVSLLTPLESQENLRSITQLWLSHRQPNDMTYVYYGAVPGFRYQLGLADVEDVQTLPPLWYTQCWRAKEDTESCATRDIFYGRWIRVMEPDEKKKSVLQTLDGVPERLWLVSSHIHNDEDRMIVDALADIYVVSESYQAENSSLFLLKRK